MDLMIDCMSYCNASFVDDDKLYEMLEDDMRTIANLSNNNNNNNSTTTSNSSSSPSCLSDEEQLAALSNDTTNLIDEFLLFNNSSSGNSTSSHISPNSNTNQQQQQLPMNANSSNSSSAANSSSNNGILSHHTPTTGLSSNSNSPSSTTSSSSSNSSSSSYYQSPPVLSYHHQHSGDIFNYSTSSSSSSSPSSSSTSSPSISAVPSPLSLSSSSSSLCAALANASFSSGSSSSSSSACSSNLASPVCLSPGQQAAHFHSSSQQLSLPPQHPHQYHHAAAQISPSSHLHHPQQQQQQQHIIHHPYQNYQQVQQQQPQQEQFMLSESTINYHLNKQKQHLMLEDDFGTTNVVGGSNNVSQYMVQAQETSYNPSATNIAASTRPSPNTMTGNAAYSLFQTINPMDINRNYAATTSESQQFNTTTKASRPMCLPTNGNSNNKTAYLNTTSGQQTIKRGKFSHNQQPGVFRIKQESSSSIQSDGESSSVSNESDSNSSTFSNDHNIQHFTSQSKKLIITATKLETQSFYSSSSSASSSPSSTSSSSQQQPQFTPTQTSLPSINVIKIAAANQKEHADNLLLPITPAKISIVEPTSASNTKTIIQYKQIVNPSVNTTTAKQSIKHSKQNGNTTTTAATTATTTPSSNNAAVSAAVSPVQVTLRSDGKAYPKPPYSYSCLIAMALRNSDSGTLPVSDIYEFIVENFPYYKTARDGWKNSIRHNLSLNKCFEKIENPTNGSKKGCLWALNPDKCKKLEEECKRCRQRDPVNIRLSMSRPDDLNKIERGEQRIKKYTAQRKQQQQQMSLDSANTSNTQSDAASNGSSSPSTFLLEWSSKSNPANQSQSLVKDEPSDQFENFDDLGNSDIKFDPILLSTVNSTI